MMDALFGLLARSDASVPTACSAARNAFVTIEGGRASQWSDSGSWLVCAADAPRDTSRIATSPSGRYQVAIAGTLHYREDLARHLDLPAGADALNAIGDARLVAAAWDSWEDRAPEHLEGEFCLAVIGVRDRTVRLVKSRIEYAPFYSVETPGLVGFATRLAHLTRLPGVGATLDPVGVARAVSNYQIQANEIRRTCVRGIDRIPLATVSAIGRDRSRQWEYWSPDADSVTVFRTEDEVHGEVRERLRAAIVERVRGEQVVATLVSGGLDSSSVTCLAARELEGRGTLVGIASVLPDEPLRGAEPDERLFIEQVGRHANIEVAMVSPGANVNPWQVPDDFFRASEGPGPSPRHYLYDALHAAAAGRGARVVLDGGFGELGPSAPLSISRVAQIRRGGFWSLAGAVPGRLARLARVARPTRHTGPVCAPVAFAPWLNAALSEDVLRHSGLADEMGAAHPPDPRLGRSSGHMRIGFPPLWRKVARAQAGNRAIEVHLPFRDPRLWQYCAGLPAALLFGKGHNRYLLRAAMQGVLPARIQWRTSKGAFSPDYYARLGRDLGWARQLVADVSPQESAAQFLDTGWTRSTLDAISAADIHHPNIRLVLLLQGTVTAIQYLRWFDRTHRGLQ